MVYLTLIPACSSIRELWRPCGYWEHGDNVEATEGSSIPLFNNLLTHKYLVCLCIYSYIYIDIYAYSWKSSEFRWNTKCTFVLQGRLVRTGPLCNLTQDTTWSIASVTYNPFAENVWRILNKCFLRRTTKNQRLTLKKIYMNMVIIVMLKKISLHRVYTMT